MKSTNYRASYDEKRHSKPCKFFQKGKCPLSAEQCDFAHVKVSVDTAIPLKTCKQFLAGRCDRGTHCRYHHPVLASEQAWKDAPHNIAPRFEAVVLEDGLIIASPSPTTHWPVPHPYYPSHDPRYFASLPSLLPTPQPISRRFPRAPAPTPVSFPTDSIFKLIIRSGGDLSPTSDASSYDGTFSQSSSPASAKSALLVDGDSDSAMPSHTQKAGVVGSVYSHSEYRGTEWLGSPATPADNGGYFIPLGMFSPNVPHTPNPNEYFGPVTPVSAVPKEQPIPLSNRKIKAFKTKHCKFFKKEGQCPQGARCTFIHDPSTVRYPSECSPETPRSASSAGSHTSLPEKPRTNIEDKRSRGIYPITWRVIGGGVMMGGQREVCRRFMEGNCADGDDCAFAHPDNNERHDLGNDEALPEQYLVSPAATPRASTFSHAQLRVPASNVERQGKTPSRALSITIPGVPDLLPDVSPEAHAFKRVKREMISRPHSTPPREYGRDATFQPLPSPVYSAESPAARR